MIRVRSSQISKSKYYFLIFTISIVTLGSTILITGYENLGLMVNYINDSVGHLTTARHIVDDHKVEGSLIFLLTLNGQATHLYMPGYHLVLALSYFLFGFSLFSTLLPNILSYCLTAFLVFYVANERYELKSGVVAAILFILIPCNIILSMMAMTEITLTFVIFLSFTIFYAAQLRFKYYLMPGLIVLCYLFRQTAILLLIPFVLQILYEDKSASLTKFSKIGGVLFITMCSIYFTNVWQMQQGLVGVDTRLLLSGGIQYGSAYQSISSEPYLSLLIQNISRNISIMQHELFPDRKLHGLNWYYQKALIVFLIGLSLTIIEAIRKIRTDFFPSAAALLSLGIFSMCVALNVAYSGVIVRIVMFTFPFIVIVVSSMLVDLSRISRIGNTGIIIVIVFMVLLALRTDDVIRKALSKYHVISERRIGFFKAINPSSFGILVSPVGISMEWVSQSYPQRWAFVPTDIPTLNLLTQKHPVGTMVLSEYNLKTLPVKALEDVGMRLVGRDYFEGQSYYIFKNKQA